jgi:hypothetical protein
MPSNPAEVPVHGEPLEGGGADGGTATPFRYHISPGPTAKPAVSPASLLVGCDAIGVPSSARLSRTLGSCHSDFRGVMRTTACRDTTRQPASILIALARMRGTLISIVLMACTSSEPPPPTCDGDTRPTSFTTDVVALIGHCGGEQCHGGIGQSWPYAAIVDKPTPECMDGRVYVKPGDPANSYLVQKLRGVDMCMGEQMPKGPTKLSDVDLATIERWICEGAPDN